MASLGRERIWTERWRVRGVNDERHSGVSQVVLRVFVRENDGIIMIIFIGVRGMAR
jgi:hypothetical protein